MTIQTDDEPCQNCGLPMWGIKCLSRRQICEACGGNDSKYNAQNPHPENWKFKQESTK